MRSFFCSTICILTGEEEVLHRGRQTSFGEGKKKKHERIRERKGEKQPSNLTCGNFFYSFTANCKRREPLGGGERTVWVCGAKKSRTDCKAFSRKDHSCTEEKASSPGERRKFVALLREGWRTQRG